VHSDHGTEFMDKKVQNFFVEKGIVMKLLVLTHHSKMDV